MITFACFFEYYSPPKVEPDPLLLAALGNSSFDLIPGQAVL